MTAESVPNIAVNRRAQILGGLGFRVLRVYPDDKRPVGLAWPEHATDNITTLARDFAEGRFNIGVACGPQPNHINLVAIDVDVKHGGVARWAAIENEHGPFDTATHSTPSGGKHIFFDAPDGVEIRNGRLAEGIDIRGTGGQVVVPPSSTIIEDSPAFYGEVDGRGLHHYEVMAMPPWLLEMILRPVAPAIERSVARHPSQAGQLSNADWFAEHWDWLDVLEGMGYRVVGRHGDEIYVQHPDATNEKSAIVHLGPGENWMCAYSTNMPSALRDRQINSDGSVSWTPYDWWVATVYGGDYSEATREVNRRRGGLAGAVIERAATTAAPAAQDDATSLNLGAEFWESRPVLSQIRQAAWAAKCSPDALLVQALARVATYIHPCFKLPGVEQGLIGKHQTMDFLGCVVAETSGGKTMAAGVGEMLVPAPDDPSDGTDPQIDFEQRVGSGEGIAEFFLVPQMAEDPDTGKMKPTGKRIIGKQALFMNVDEGTGFTNQAGRKGTTIVSTLASAWSGESLGQLNAASETRRLVRGGRVRICAVINMQDSNGYKLYAEDLESVGFTGRILFASAHDPAAPELSPPWPGPLRWTIWGGSAITNRYYTYAPEISTEILSTRHGILTKALRIDKRQSQYLLLRCKVAAILATLEDRLDVSVEDWALATEIVSMSATVLEHLDSVRQNAAQVTAVTAQAFKLEVAESAESQHLRRLAVGWKPRVLDELRTKGPLSWKGLKGLVRADRRDMFRSILDEMVAEGVLVRKGSTFEIG